MLAHCLGAVGIHPPADLPRSILYSYTRKWCGTADDADAIRRHRLTVEPRAREGVAQKHPPPLVVGGFARVLGCPRTPRLSAGENDRARRGEREFRRLRSAGGILPLLAIADERTGFVLSSLSARVGFLCSCQGRSRPRSVILSQTLRDRDESALTPRRKHYILW